jgi:pseudouridine kinase
MTAIACIGGVTRDRKLWPLDGLRPGTSNPVTSAVSAGGVAGNVARGLAALGCGVTIFSRVGDDGAGDETLRALEGAGVDVTGVSRSRHPTADYTAVLDGAGNLVFGLADMEIFDALEPAWADSIAPALSSFGLWIVDANLPGAVLDRLLGRKPEDVTAIADPVSVSKAARLEPVLGTLDALLPDRAEAAALSGRSTDTLDGLAEACDRLRGLGVGAVLITLGREGLYLDDGRRRELLPAIGAVGEGEVTGAGDALVAGYVWGKLAGGGLDPVRCGLAAASLTIESSESVAALSPERLMERLAEVVER